MFPLLDEDGPNPLELFQIWLNLPAADKWSEPHFAMLWAQDIPRVVTSDGAGRTSEITVIAGTVAGRRPPAPPPDSWASRSEADVAIWHYRTEPGAEWTMPPAAGPSTVRMLYVHEGAFRVGGHELPAPTGVVVAADEPVVVTGGPAGAEALVLQGRPIGEPVAQYGPFVMNDRAGIEQAFSDYRATGFGGWPWPTDDPVHGADPSRFARHADGRQERPGEILSAPA